MGPSHPSTHGTVKLALTLDGERIIDSRGPGRLPAPRLREGMRERRVLPGDPVHGPAELREPDDQQRRLLPGSGEALRHHGAAARHSISG